MTAKMAGDGHFTSSDGPGGRASRFLDAVVAFVVAIFHPIFRVFASSGNSPSNSSSPPSQPPQQAPENNHPSVQPNDDTETTMQSQHQSRSAHPHGPREVNANARSSSAVKVTLPQIGPPNGAVKQENIAANGATPATNVSRQLADATNAAKFRTVGEEQAEENRQEQLTLPPPIQPIDQQGGDEVKDPAIAAERAIHHGFMNQALDMASRSLSLISHVSCGVPPLSCCIVSETHLS